jgi:sec-independent protein translocase protein TatA
MLPTAPLFGAIPGGPEMIVILLVLVLLFGANKIPKLARSTGQAMGEFKKGREQIEEELDEMQDGDDDTDTEFVDTEMTSETSETNKN